MSRCLEKMPEALKSKDVWDCRPYANKAVFFQGSKDHVPNVPDRYVFPPDKRKKNWEAEGDRVVQVQKHVVSEVLEVVDPQGGGLRIAGDWFTLIPRSESCGARGPGKNPKGNNVNLLYESLRVVEREAKKTCRNKSRSKFVILDGVGSNYVDIGHAPVRAGRGCRSKMKAFEEKRNSLYKEFVLKWLRRVEHCADKFIPSSLRKLLGVVRKMCETCSVPLSGKQGNKIWPALVAGRNVFLNVHKDLDFFWSLTTVVGKIKPSENDPVVCYFCFPTLGMAVPLRNGDLLLFNAKIPHCVSSRCNGKEDNYCVSLYMKALLVGGNDNKQVLTEEEERLATLVKKLLC